MDIGGPCRQRRYWVDTGLSSVQQSRWHLISHKGELERAGRRMERGKDKKRKDERGKHMAQRQLPLIMQQRGSNRERQRER